MLDTIRADLRRRHEFAHERVGFVSAGLASARDQILILGCEYRPVLDAEYLRDHSVGAMMGPEAIRKALQWTMERGQALFHVHTHGGSGNPTFSSIDLRESAKFVPDFFKVAPQCLHGTLVLSNTAARGLVWLGPKHSPVQVDNFVEVGVPLRKWKAA